MLSNILLGTPVIEYGNLLIKTRAAGKRGESCSFAVVTGSPLGVAIVAADSSHGLGKGEIIVTAPVSTTETQLIALLNTSNPFRKLASVEQASGDGSAIIQALAQTSFPPGTDGLLSKLQAKVNIIGWDDRDVIASGAPVGLLMPMETSLERESLDHDGFDHYKGMVLVAIAFQHDTDFHEQNAILDLFRRAAFQAIKFFDHEDLFDTQIKGGYGNTLKKEAAGTVLKDAEIRVAARIILQWQEPAFDPEDIVTAPFDQAEIGLWREPIDTEVQTIGDGEVLDQVLTITADED